MDIITDFAVILPTWNSLGNDVPVDSETKIKVNFDYLIINWLDQNVR